MAQEKQVGGATNNIILAGKRLRRHERCKSDDYVPAKYYNHKKMVEWTRHGEYLILIIVGFNIIAAVYTISASAGNALNATGFPLGTLFVGGGLVFLILAAMFLMFYIKVIK